MSTVNTKSMITAKENRRHKIKIYGETIEQVDSFKCLVTIINIIEVLIITIRI